MDVTIRKFQTGDGAAAFDVFVRSVRELGSASYTSNQIEAWLSGMTPRRLESRLLAMVSFVAVAEDRVIGFSSLDSRHAELDFLYVDPLFTGRGTGRDLARHVEQAARDMKIDVLFIVASLNAVKIYEKLGYEHEYDMSKMIDGIQVPCIRMAKSLATS